LQKNQATIERTLLIGVVIGLLIGFISRRVTYGLLLGIGLSWLIYYMNKPTDKES